MLLMFQLYMVYIQFETFGTNSYILCIPSNTNHPSCISSYLIQLYLKRVIALVEHVVACIYITSFLFLYPLSLFALLVPSVHVHVSE